MNQFHASVVSGVVAAIVSATLAAILGETHISPFIILEGIGAGVAASLVSWFIVSNLNQRQERKRYQLSKDRSAGESLAEIQEYLFGVRRDLGIYLSECSRNKEMPRLQHVDSLVRRAARHLRRLGVPYPEVDPEVFDAFIYLDHWDLFLGALHPISVDGDIGSARRLWPLYKGPSMLRRARDFVKGIRTRNR